MTIFEQARWFFIRRKIGGLIPRSMPIGEAVAIFESETGERLNPFNSGHVSRLRFASRMAMLRSENQTK